MPFELSYRRRQDNSKINADLRIIVTYYRNTETRDLSLTHSLPLFLSQNHTPQKLNKKYFVLQSCMPKLFQIWIWVCQYEKNLSLRWLSWWQTLESLSWPAFSPGPRSWGHRAGRRWVRWTVLLFPLACGLWGSFCSINQLLLHTPLILLLLQDSSPALMAWCREHHGAWWYLETIVLACFCCAVHLLTKDSKGKCGHG